MPATKIFISGPNFLQNTLLAECLTQGMQVECTCVPNLRLADLIEKEKNRTCVCLFDCFYCEIIEIDNRLDASAVACPENLLPALFNVSPDYKVENLVRRNAVRGIFYQKDSQKILLKGVKKILNGELWFTRQMLSRCILRPSTKTVPRLCIPSLSQRENEILQLLATGASNQAIADNMCISPNTVKTHLYNIYKKIGVPNRLQATLYATNYPSN